MSPKIAVVAIGGNSLIRNDKERTVQDQHREIEKTCNHISDMIQAGWTVAITHGNGPQVGFILRRSELAAHELHELPLEICVADTQGSIGYSLQQCLSNDFRQRGMDRRAVTVVTQVEVDAADPAFAEPSKPIGSFMTEAEARQRAANAGWHVVEDAGRGWRRVVASPQPLRIVETDVIQALLEQGIIVVAGGGGGIPVARDAQGDLYGVPAVVDKDRASALLAHSVGAELLLISTAVEKVLLNFKRPDQRPIDHMTLAEAQQYMDEGVHFVKGSMRPKMQSVINFLELGGRQAIITNPENIGRALRGETGTHVTRE